METLQWSLKELKDAVLNIHGRQYSDRISDPLQTFGLRSAMSGYHAKEYKRILKKIIPSTEPTNEGNLNFNPVIFTMFSALLDENKSSKLLAVKFRAEAHIIASAQSLHALCDILANIIFLACRLDSYPVPPREDRIDLFTVRKFLKMNSVYEQIQQSISKIITSPEYKYLNAFVNTSKHKTLVSSTLSASFLGKKAGLLLNEFIYKGYQFHKKWSQDFVFNDNQKLKGELLMAGNTLNDTFK